MLNNNNLLLDHNGELSVGVGGLVGVNGVHNNKSPLAHQQQQHSDMGDGNGGRGGNGGGANNGLLGPNVNSDGGEEVEEVID